MLRVVIFALVITSATGFFSTLTAVYGSTNNLLDVAKETVIVLGKVLNGSDALLASLKKYETLFICEGDEVSPAAVPVITLEANKLAQRETPISNNSQIQCSFCELSGIPESITCHNLHAMNYAGPKWKCEGRFPNENFGLLSATLFCETRTAPLTGFSCTRKESCVVVILPYRRHSSMSQFGVIVCILFVGACVYVICFYRHYVKRRQPSALPLPLGAFQMRPIPEQHSAACISDGSLAPTKTARPWLHPQPPPPPSQIQLAPLPPPPQPQSALPPSRVRHVLPQPLQPHIEAAFPRDLLPSAPTPPRYKSPLPLLRVPPPSRN